MKRIRTITETLHEAIQHALDAGQTYKGLERDSGVKRQSLMKFMRGETSLRLDIADKLAEHFHLELKQRGKK